VSSEEADIVKGLNWGADDYMAKPFRQLELMARVKALARRTRFPAEEPLLAFGELRFEPSKRRLLCGEKEIRLTQSEGNIMRRLLKEPGHSVTLSSLAEAVWGSDCGGSDGLKVYIRRLREKIEADPKNPQIILTKAGVGYFLADPETAGQYPGCRVPSAN